MFVDLRSKTTSYRVMIANIVYLEPRAGETLVHLSNGHALEIAAPIDTVTGQIREAEQSRFSLDKPRTPILTAPKKDPHGQASDAS